MMELLMIIAGIWLMIAAVLPCAFGFVKLADWFLERKTPGHIAVLILLGFVLTYGAILVFSAHAVVQHFEQHTDAERVLPVFMPGLGSSSPAACDFPPPLLEGVKK